MRELASLVAKYIEETDNVSFAELSNRFPEFRDGKYEFVLGETNIVIWCGMTTEAVNAINSLFVDQVIGAVPSSVMVYMIDGAMLKLPIAKRSGPYKKPHWAPVVLRPYAKVPPKFRRKRIAPK